MQIKYLIVYIHMFFHTIFIFIYQKEESLNMYYSRNNINNCDKKKIQNVRRRASYVVTATSYIGCVDYSAKYTHSAHQITDRPCDEQLN